MNNLYLIVKIRSVIYLKKLILFVEVRIEVSGNGGVDGAGIE